MVDDSEIGHVSLRERLDLARKQVGANLVRLQESRAQLNETVAQIEAGRSERDRLRTAAFARLQARLESQPVIEQAKGILMAKSGCKPEEAFDILRRASQRTNVKVRDLAAEIVDKTSGQGR
jgi:AmiR/NasT family two-component response regulator